MTPSFWIYRNENISLREKMFAFDFDSACKQIGEDWEHQAAKFNQQ